MSVLSQVSNFKFMFDFELETSVAVSETILDELLQIQSTFSRLMTSQYQQNIPQESRQ